MALHRVPVARHTLAFMKGEALAFFMKNKFVKSAWKEAKSHFGCKVKTCFTSNVLHELLLHDEDPRPRPSPYHHW